MRIRNDYTRSQDILDEEIEFIATISDALAHPARIKMMRFIMDCNKQMKNVCNKDLVEHFGYAQATISQHMKSMIKSGLIQTKKVERYTYYYVNVGDLIRYVDTVKKL